MRLFLIALFLLLPIAGPAQATPSVAPIPNHIIAQENAFWTAYAAGNTTALTSLLLPDFTSVEEDIWNRQQVLDFVKMFFSQCKLAPVKILAPQVTFLTPEIATIVYHATESPTCGTQTMSGDTNISTVWVKRDSRWQMQLHTEYAAPPKKD